MTCRAQTSLDPFVYLLLVSLLEYDRIHWFHKAGYQTRPVLRRGEWATTQHPRFATPLYSQFNLCCDSRIICDEKSVWIYTSLGCRWARSYSALACNHLYLQWCFLYFGRCSSISLRSLVAVPYTFRSSRVFIPFSCTTFSYFDHDTMMSSFHRLGHWKMLDSSNSLSLHRMQVLKQHDLRYNFDFVSLNCIGLQQTWDIKEYTLVNGSMMHSFFCRFCRCIIWYVQLHARHVFGEICKHAAFLSWLLLFRQHIFWK